MLISEPWIVSALNSIRFAIANIYDIYYMFTCATHAAKKLSSNLKPWNIWEDFESKFLMLDRSMAVISGSFLVVTHYS